MIDREHDLSITKQAAALNISRGSVYYLSRPVSASDLEVMRRLELFLEHGRRQSDHGAAKHVRRKVQFAGRL